MVEARLDLAELCKKLDKVPASDWFWRKWQPFYLHRRGVAYTVTVESIKKPFPYNNSDRSCYCLVVKDGSSVRRYSTDDTSEIAVGKVLLRNLYKKLQAIRRIEDKKVLVALDEICISIKALTRRPPTDDDCKSVGYSRETGPTRISEFSRPFRRSDCEY